MSNPYDCSVCHNEGYDHAPDCPFHPDNLADPDEGRNDEHLHGETRPTSPEVTG